MLQLNLCVVGLGYVGLPLIFGLRRAGYHYVTGVDIDVNKVESLRMKIDYTHMIDPDLFIDECVNIGWTTEYPEEADIFFVCVPTPDDNGKPDYSFVDAAVQSIVAVAKPYASIVIESTVGPGTTKSIAARLSALGRNDICVAFSPERINPGPSAFYLMFQQPKALAFDFGTIDQRKNVENVYRNTFHLVSVFEDTRVCEIAKCFENAQRDTNIALMNELSMRCHASGVDYKEVVRALRTKSSSPEFRSGMVGGHCIPVDPYYLEEWYQKNIQGPTVIGRARGLNECYIKYVETLCLLHHEGTKRVLILGEAYKPDVNDVRNSGAHKLAETLQFSLNVYIYDPVTGAFPTVSDDYPFGVVIGATNHSAMLEETYSSKFPIHPKATFINVGGFSARQMADFPNIINL